MGALDYGYAFTILSTRYCSPSRCYWPFLVATGDENHGPTVQQGMLVLNDTMMGGLSKAAALRGEGETAIEREVVPACSAAGGLS
jgi:hypothetical protein